MDPGIKQNGGVDKNMAGAPTDGLSAEVQLIGTRYLDASMHLRAYASLFLCVRGHVDECISVRLSR